MDPVVGVGHDQPEAGIGGAMEEIEEDDGVESSGDGDQRPALRQRQRREMRPKLVEETHRAENNRLTRTCDGGCFCE
jgi:hypothetical protein